MLHFVLWKKNAAKCVTQAIGVSGIFEKKAQNTSTNNGICFMYDPLATKTKSIRVVHSPTKSYSYHLDVML
jgi:hypothetical protein